MSSITLQDARAGLAIAALTVVAMACAATATPPAGQTSGPTPVASAPQPSPTAPQPSALATDTLGSAVVSLANATGNDITVEIVAPTGVVRSAASGTPGDGATVEPYRLVATNDDPATLRLTWSGGPCDARDTLLVDPDLGRLVLVEPECSGDAVAFDRVLVVHLATPIDAASLEAVVQDGLDTTD